MQRRPVMSPAEAARAMMVMSELKVTTFALTPARSIRPRTSSAFWNAVESRAAAARAHALTAKAKTSFDACSLRRRHVGQRG